MTFQLAAMQTLKNVNEGNVQKGMLKKLSNFN
jgi:hypothetical protein